MFAIIRNLNLNALICFGFHDKEISCNIFLKTKRPYFCSNWGTIRPLKIKLKKHTKEYGGYDFMGINEEQGNRSNGQKSSGIGKIVFLFLLILAIILLIFRITERKQLNKNMIQQSRISSIENDPEEKVTSSVNANLLTEANDLAMQYDYDGAIALLESQSIRPLDKEVKAAIADYEATKSTLVRVNPEKVTHVFFHSLIIDTDKAFDGDKKEGGYNQVMTTKNEFLQIMQSMYDKGYVLVKIHDVASKTKDKNGNSKFTYGDIMLPKGKKAFVLSQDDVCYYEYMEGDGFATKIVIGKDGYPTCEMKMEDGTISTGDYDLVPVLENFIKEHPDFSYKGARGILAFTGYNGILGYRTDESYKKTNPNYKADRAQAAKVAKVLKKKGWEMASHSWGHRDMGKIPMNHFKFDADKWEKNVESLIGPTDIIIYPFGSDVGSWKPYTSSNERFNYLKAKGFSYFCHVDASQPYWTQLGPDYFRQGRRNLDGYRMYYYPKYLSDLFKVSDVFDPARPTPVPKM